MQRIFAPAYAGANLKFGLTGGAASLRPLFFVLQKCKSLWNLAKCRFFDGGGLTFNGSKLKRIYNITQRTNNRGEFAIAAKNNNGDHWIIELKPNGTEKRRTRAVGKLYEYGALYYVDF